MTQPNDPGHVGAPWSAAPPPPSSPPPIEQPPWTPAPGQFGYRSPEGPRVARTVLGWPLISSGALVAVAAFLPWATTSHGSLAGTEGDGAITFFFGLLIVVMGLLIKMRQGRRWVPIVAVVVAGLTTLAGITDAANVARFSADFAHSELSVSVGFGLWLTLAAALVAVGLSVVAIIRRVPQPEA